METRELGRDDLAMATEIFLRALGEDLGDVGRGAWIGYLEMSRTLGAFDGDRMIGTAMHYPARVTLPGGASLAVHAVTGVGVLPTHTRRGAGRALMADQVQAAVADGAAAMILEASEATIYGKFGYGPVCVHHNALLPAAHTIFRSPVAATGSFDYAEPEAVAHHAPPIHEAWRVTRPGQMNRPVQTWGMTLVDIPEWRGGGGPLQWVFHLDDAGTPDGYVAYRTQFGWDGSVPAAEARIMEVVAPTPEVRLQLLQFVAEIDLVAYLNITGLASDDELHHALVDPRRLKIPDTRDGLWVRVIDVAAALTARQWWAQDTLVLRVEDEDLDAVAGTWQVEVRDGKATVGRTDATPDLELGVAELGMILFGGVTARNLAQSGRVRGSQDAIDRATVLFRGLVAPNHTGEF